MANESGTEPVNTIIITESEEGISAGEIVIGALYIFAVGINIYIIVDQATDGALSREMSMMLYHLKGKVKAIWREHKEFHKQKGRVVWEAMETLNDKENGQ